MKWKKDKKEKQAEKKNQIVRIEELEDMLEKYGDDVDPETIISMYVHTQKEKKNRCSTAENG